MSNHMVADYSASKYPLVNQPYDDENIFQVCNKLFHTVLFEHKSSGAI